MSTYELDDIDKRLLDLLQEDARYTATELADRLGVSDNTVHNRMAALEDAEVITGYTTGIDHERTGLGLTFMFTCTTRISQRSDMAEEIRKIPEVVEVTELMTGQRNVLVKAAGAEDEDITRVARQVDELDVEINDENLVREVHDDTLDYVEIGDMLSEDD